METIFELEYAGVDVNESGDELCGANGGTCTCKGFSEGSSETVYYCTTYAA